jgi:peroxiredoxin
MNRPPRDAAAARRGPASAPAGRRRVRSRALAGVVPVGVLLVAALAAPAPALARRGGMKEAFQKHFVGKPAPRFALKDLKGRTVRLSDFRGKVVLLNFWFSTCGPCRMETPDLVTLYRAYTDRGFEVLGINLDELLIPYEEGRQLKSFLATFKMPYPILLADARVYQDYGSAPIQPVSFLIDREGTVRQVFWGAFPGGAFERALRPHLFPDGGKPSPPAPAPRPTAAPARPGP